MEVRLSVIIPLYNSAQWLEKCLLSVLNQDISEEQMDIICINDGSPDNSAELAHSIAKEHPCITVLDQENQGPSGARNNGLRHAKGKYLIFVDPDDYLEPNVLGCLVQQMENEQLNMLRFDFRRVDDNGTELPILAEDAIFDNTPELMSGAAFLANRLGIGCNIWRYMYRTELITKNEIWCYTGDYFDDTPWLPRVLLKAQKINCVNTLVYNYWERQNGLVKAQSESAITKKIDGHFLLISLLQEQMESIELNKLYVSEDLKSGVLDWYRNMIAHSALTLLTLAALYRFSNRKATINKLNAMHVFPLSVRRTTKKALRKVKWINRSPLLYMWMIKIKNRK